MPPANYSLPSGRSGEPERDPRDFAIGVQPNAQRRGVGGALLAAGFAVVDADHLPCHLHTSDPANIDYYQRWEFELSQPAFTAGSRGPTYYGMTRPAADR